MTITDTTATQAEISRLRVLDQNELTPATARLFANLERTTGYVPNWLKAFALGGSDSDRLNAYLFPLLEGTGPRASSLTVREREIIATIVSVENRCSYCHPLHVDGLGRTLGDYQLATRIGLDYREVDELTARERALAELATVLTRAPREFGKQHIGALRDLGLSDSDIFEAVEIASVVNATNRISIAVAVLPDQELFDAQDVALQPK